MRCKPCPNRTAACWCILHPGNTRQGTIKKIKQAVCKEFNVSKQDLESNSRKKHLVKARQVAMNRCRRETDATLKEIGLSFNRNHSTVSHALNKGNRKNEEG